MTEPSEEMDYCLHGSPLEAECYRCLEHHHHELRLKNAELTRKLAIAVEQRNELVFELHGDGYNQHNGDCIAELDAELNGDK